MDFKVGQLWQTRDGRKATITSLKSSYANGGWPIEAQIEGEELTTTYTMNGIEACNQRSPAKNDLLFLLDENTNSEQTDESASLDNNKLEDILKEELSKDYVTMLPAADAAKRMAEAIRKANA